MKKQTVLKKLLSSLLVAIIVLGQFSGYGSVVQAATVNTADLEEIYLSLSKTNDNGIGYANIAEEYIYAIKCAEDAAGTGEVSSSNLYCIKAEYSNTWNTEGYETRIKYNWQTEFNKNLETTPSEEVNKLISGYIVNGESINYFNEILWILDNMYVPGESNLTEFLEQADIYYDDYDEGYIYLSKNGHDYTQDGIAGISNVYPTALTEDDIIAIQQAALWYFTNYEDSDYNSLDTSSWLRYTNDGSTYAPFSSNKTGEAAREVFSYVLYNYLVDEALAATANLNDGEYELKNSTVKLWLSVTEGADNKEQPVVEIHKKPKEQKEFDLSLRKSIASVKNSKNTEKEIVNAYGDLAIRQVNIDASKLNTKKAETTAKYAHRKDPVVVETGDTVTYAITIYNEGAQAGYATIIKDKLPGTWNTGLRLENNQSTVTAVRTNREDGNVYDVTYETETNTVILTISENSSKKVLTAFDEEDGITGYETVYIECKVMGKPSTVSSKVLTNIAYIAEDYNAETNTILDRDSEPTEYPEYSNSALITDDIGYTGNSSNPTDFESLSSDETYYKGQQDDDDFEKIVIFPETFDLSLRKNITEVTDKNGNEVTIDDRTPQIDTTKLDSGLDTTTADYKHRKDVVVVENGSKVTYDISLHNEGSVDGAATIVRDQLPTGLELNLEYFKAENGKYYTTSSKGNVYEVSYDKSSNLVTFTLDEEKTASVYLLKAHENGEKLDKDTLTLQCTVNCKADDDQKIYLTNIAYIYEAKQEDGTVVTTQEEGPDADRDSQPHTYPYKNQTANDLKTTGDIGYTGGKTYTAEQLTDSNTYYEGQQDDDDFEKLVILPETFDLSLRKNITEVTDGEENKVTINDRTPKPNITNLDSGVNTTTADYNHRKDPIIVENGSKVIYNISLYNEGSIDGLATIVRDQLPVGLKLNLNYFSKVDEKYYTTSSKGNVYDVTYNEETNLVTFTLDEEKPVEYLSAHELGNELDKDIITLHCEVEHIADSTKNIYLTNIAYIYEAKQIDGTVITTQTTGSDADRDSQPHTYPYVDKTANDLTTTGTIGYTGASTYTAEQLGDSNTYYVGKQDDDDFEKLVMLPKTFDLKLIKFITQVNDEATGNRVINVDTSKLNTIDAETTAKYILEKNPVPVKAGDFITYTLRVYNEGNYDGYATEISESIPAGLEFIVVADGVISSWDGKELKDITEEIKTSEMYQTIIDVNSNWGFNKENSIITTKALSEELIKAFEQGKDIDYAEVKVIFRVKEDVEANITIRNEAAISEDKAVDNDGNPIDVSDRDSTPDEWKKENSEETYDEEGKWPIYKEDDEDYDNIITKAFDLSLRKQIVQINDDINYTGRYANLLTRLEENANTIYDYYNVYSNKPKVKAGDKVLYSIRVYNEGDIDGYASLIVDTLPSGLEFVEYVAGDGSINDKYGWTLLEGTNNVYQTDYLSFEKDSNKGTDKSTILKAYDGQGEASYQEIYIECKVKENVTKEDKLLNVAQIAEDSDESGKPIRDKDSVPGTSDNENKWKEEDDLDIEILELQEFDLSLRKFITQVENSKDIKEITTRIPQVSYNKETKQLVYTHTKDALIVHVGDTVIYTLRVYNEGDIDGYASEIKDDIPEYLEYLPTHNTNKEYKWTMYDKEGNETEDVGKAVFIKTKYLSKENGEENLIKAFNSDDELSEKNPDYKEVKVAFKVKDPNSTTYEIVNFAQISDDSDSNGDPIKDRDSEPDNAKDQPKEDDEDIEKVKVQYFDLSLIKYVTKVIVNENGEKRIIETGNVGDENDIIPNVQIYRNNMYKTVVKFVYTIQIKNEGQIAGEATEITDYVPEGLEFLEEDNEFWTDEGNNVISTKQLEGTILQPGETAEVEVVLRWINGKDNLGPKTNVAEISEDHNEENVPDRDSTPDNKKEGEDDIDEATVLLSPRTGGGIPSIYINLITIFLGIILIGAILIKKFVL